MTYDAFGHMLSQRAPTGAEMRYAYTPRGDLIAYYNPEGGVTRYSYDGERHLTQLVSPQGHATQFTWGGFQSMCGRRDARGHVVRLAYSREGELLGVVNERDEVHRLAYDKAGQLVEEETFDGRQLRYRNDLTGRVVRAENGAGEITTYVYDLAGQLIELELPDETKEAFEYDLRGELVKATCPAGEFTFERDAIGRVIREAQTVDGTEHWVTVQYDGTDRRIGRETSLGHTAHMERNAMGARTRTVIDRRDQLEHVHDLLSHEVQRRLPNGGTIESSFDVMGRLAGRAGRSPTEARVLNPGEPEWLGRRADGVTSLTTYQYDADGDVVSESDRSRGLTRYDCDPVGQLLAAVPEKARAEVFRYDPTGNIFDVGAGAGEQEYGKGNRLVRKGNTSYSYDSDGRLVQKREQIANDVLAWHYGWNGQGLLAWVETPHGKRVEFSYDPFARRVDKRVKTRRDGVWEAETATRFVWDGDCLAHEISDGVGIRTFLFCDGGLTPMAQSAGDGWLHFINDTAGAPQRLLDGGGNLAGEVETSTWGLAESADKRAPTPLRFQGQYADDETGLFYNRFRYYDPATTRFLSPDPLGPAAALNQYRYGPNPISWIDPLGLWAPGNPGPVTTQDTSAAPGVSRPSTVTATIRPVDLGTGSATNASSRAAARSKGCSTDDAGHPIANRLGGQGGVNDVFPQDPHINRGAFRDHEADVAAQVAALPPGQSAQVQITYQYPNATATRHNGILYSTTINGTTTTVPFNN